MADEQSVEERLRQWARYSAVEDNFDGDLTPEKTFYWEAADLIASLCTALAAKDAELEEARDVLRWFVQFADTGIAPEKYIEIVKRARALSPLVQEEPDRP